MNAPFPIFNPTPFSTAVARVPALLWPQRQMRVLILLAALAVMSAADLWMTLLHMRSGGMMEANFIVRFLATMGSPALLAGWKIAGVTPFLLLMYSRRHRAGAEFASLAACLLLGFVTWRWIGYSDLLIAYGNDIFELHHASPYWVAMR